MWQRIAPGGCALVVMICLAGGVRGQEFYDSARTEALRGDFDLRASPGSTLTDSSVERLLKVDPAESSRLRRSRSWDRTGNANTMDVFEPDRAGAERSNLLMLGSLGAACLLGAGLCCAGMFAGRRRKSLPLAVGLVIRP